MNVATSSPALVLAYVFALLWILMDVRLGELSKRQKVFVPVIVAVLAVFNHYLRIYLGAAAYGKLIFLTMHLPYFLLFWRLTKCSVIKMSFMILSAVIFMAPTIFVGNFVKRAVEIPQWGLLLSNLITYGIMLMVAQFVFRRGFNYLLKYADNRFFIRISLIPILYYVYLFGAMNQDFSSLNSVGGLIVRLLPTVYVFVFYSLLLHNYRELDEKKNYETTQALLNQQLASAKEQIALLNNAQTQTAIYQHNMRHHLNAIGGYLSSKNTEGAESYIKNVQSDIESITHKRYCENELVNLLCSSFAGKAEQNGVRLTFKVKLPKNISISDTELCSLMSNGLENALHAACKADENTRWVELYSDVRNGKLLIEIKNSYVGQVTMEDGLPISKREGHGYGCRSIRSITEQNHGLCTFGAENGTFILRIILPLSPAGDIK